MKSKEMRQRFGELVDAQRKIVDRYTTEKRKINADEDAEMRRLDAELDDLEPAIQRQEKLEARESALAAPATRPALLPATTPESPEDAAARAHDARVTEYAKRYGRLGQRIASRMADPRMAHVTSKAYRSAFMKWMGAPLKTGLATLTSEEQRALSQGTASEGGYTVPQEEFLAELIKEVDNQAVLRGISRTFQVTQAQSLGAPTLASDPSDPDWTSELQVGTEDSTMAFGRRELWPKPLAKYIKVSDKLLRASPLGMEEIVRDRLAYKFAVAQSSAFNTGDGANKPIGIYHPTADGIPTSRDVEIAASNALVPGLLIDARFTLRQGYWPNAKWHMHRNWLREFRKLKHGTDNNFLWQPGLTVGAPNTLLDFPYVIDEYAPSVTTIGAGVYAAVLGDFSHYWIVDALTFQMKRLDELFALSNQVAFVIRGETDAQPVLGDAFVRLKATAT